MKKKEKIKPLKSKTTISDLLNMIHFTIIKKQGVNDVILKELIKIDDKISNGKLLNYDVDCPLYWTALFRDLKDNGYVINE